MTDTTFADDGEAYTARNEGCILVPYDDATGKPVLAGGHATGTLTVGRGHTGADVVAGEAWSQAHADGTYAIDYAGARFGARRDVGAQLFDNLDPWRRYALIDIAFEIGAGGLAKFREMIAGIWDGDWDRASSEEWKSLLPRGRAARNEFALKSAVAPPDELWS